MLLSLESLNKQMEKIKRDRSNEGLTDLNPVHEKDEKRRAKEYYNRLKEVYRQSMSDIETMEKELRENERELKRVGGKLEGNDAKDYLKGKPINDIPYKDPVIREVMETLINSFRSGLRDGIKRSVDEDVRQGKYPKEVGDKILEGMLKEYKYKLPDKKPIGFMDLNDGILKDALCGRLSEDRNWPPVSEFPSQGSLIFTRSGFRPFKS